MTAKEQTIITNSAMPIRCMTSLRADCAKLDKAPVFLPNPQTAIGGHSLRYSNATLLDAVGTLLVTVQSLLGH